MRARHVFIQIKSFADKNKRNEKNDFSIAARQSSNCFNFDWVSSVCVSNSRFVYIFLISFSRRRQTISSNRPNHCNENHFNAFLFLSVRGSGRRFQRNWTRTVDGLRCSELFYLTTINFSAFFFNNNKRCERIKYNNFSRFMVSPLNQRRTSEMENDFIF